MEDKLKIIEKIATSPENLTDQEILTISADSDLRDLYQGASVMSAALADVPGFDTESSLCQLHMLIGSQDGQASSQGGQASSLQKQGKEKAKSLSLSFAKRLRGMSHIGRAAIVIGGLLTAVAVVAAICFAHVSQDITESPEIQSVQDTLGGGQLSTEPEYGKLYYDDAPLSQILSDVCARYDCEVRYANPEVGDNRYHLTIPSEASLQQVVEMLNAFDEVEITTVDNCLIVQ